MYFSNYKSNKAVFPRFATVFGVQKGSIEKNNNNVDGDDD